MKELDPYMRSAQDNLSGPEKLKMLGISYTIEFGDKYRKWLTKMNKRNNNGEYVGYQLSVNENNITIIGEKGTVDFVIKDYAKGIPDGVEAYRASMVHYAHGGTIDLFVSKTSDEVLDHLTRDKNPKYKKGQTVYSHIRPIGPSFHSKVTSVGTEETEHFGRPAYIHKYTLSKAPAKQGHTEYIKGFGIPKIGVYFYEDELFPTLGAMKKELRNYEQSKERYEKHGELFAHGGTIPSAWRTFLNWLNEKI